MRTDLCLALAAALVVLSSLAAGLVSVVVLLIRSLGPVQAGAALAASLLLVAMILWIILRLRRRARKRLIASVPAGNGLPADPVVFATFLAGFLLARRFLGPR